MDITMNQVTGIDVISRIKALTDRCRISNIEDLLSNYLETLPNESPVDYIGELNRNDVMH